MTSTLAPTPGRFALLFAACFVVAAIPVLSVDPLPLLDYPNHLARMHVLAEYDRVPALREFYEIRWRPLPNLAMDLVVPPLSRIIGLTAASKAFILLAFLLTAGGIAALHRSLFGTWSAWPLLGFLLLYNRSLIWGFENFLFGAGLALMAAASWTALRERNPWLRQAAACLLALALYLAHFFAFGAYALTILGFELGRLRRKAWPGAPAAARAMAEYLPQFVLPAGLFASVAGSGGAAAGGIVYSRFIRKLDLVFTVFDNYVTWLDILTLLLVAALFIAPALRRRLEVSGMMGPALAMLALAQLAMPNRILGAAGVDHRMMLILAALLIAATRPLFEPRRSIALVAAAVFVARIAIVEAAWLEQDRGLAPMVAALAELPRGSRLAVAYSAASIHAPRRAPPVVHLAALAVVEADAFVPTLFADPGQQPMVLRPAYAALAARSTPGALWDLLVDHNPAEHNTAAALASYDFVVVVGAGGAQAGEDPRLALRQAGSNAWLYAIRKSAQSPGGG